MKNRISATVESATLKIVDELMKSGKYRNKSHIIEDAIKLLGESQLKTGKKGGKK